MAGQTRTGSRFSTTHKHHYRTIGGIQRPIEIPRGIPELPRHYDCKHDELSDGVSSELTKRGIGHVLL